MSRRILYLVVNSETMRPAALGDAGISGLATALTSRDYKLLVLPESSHDRALQELQQMLAASECDGCILRVVQEDQWNWSAIHETKRPILILGRVTNSCLPSLCYDSRGSMQHAVRHLIDRGHRQLGFLAGHANAENTDYVTGLWQAVSSDFGIDPTRWFNFAGERTEADAIASDWLAEDNGPTALICMHNRSAVGATNAILRRGLQLAGNCDLIVLGDIVLGGAISPWLYEPGTWYFDNDEERIGMCAAQKIMNLIEARESPGPFLITPKLRQVTQSL
jgi:DNA-binding LacI/PurR family transcriptional regulator